MSGGLASRRRQSQAGEAQGLDSVPQSLLHHAGPLGTLWSVRRGFCLEVASSPRHTLAGSDRMMLPFPEEGGQHLPAHTSTVAAPVQSWGSSGTFGQARRSQSQHSRHPGLENSLLWGLTCALLYVSLSLWPQPTDASSTIPPSLSKL